MQRACQICGFANLTVYRHYTPSRGYSCFECDMVADPQIAIEATQHSRYAHAEPCTKCNRRNTRSVRYPIYCCIGCATRYHLSFDVCVIDNRTKNRHCVVIDREKTIGILARRVSRFGGGIEYKGVVYDPSISLHTVGILPGESVIFYGTPDEYDDDHNQSER